MGSCPHCRAELDKVIWDGDIGYDSYLCGTRVKRFEMVRSEACKAAELDRLRSSVSTLCDAMESMLPLIRLLTIRQVIQASDDAINAVGLNPWCISEGLATGDEMVSVSKFERAIREAKGE